MTLTMDQLELSAEQRLMQQTTREYVDRVVIPFIRANREREWLFEPDERLPTEHPRGGRRRGPARARGARPVRRGGAGPGNGGADVRRDRHRARPRGRRARRQAGPGLEGVGAPAERGAGAPPGALVPRYMADPSFLMAHCLTEPKGASDRWLPYNVPEANMDTRATFADGHWTINGRKHYISNGYDASLYVVYANTNPAVGMLQGTSSFLVPRDTPGRDRHPLQRDDRRPVHEQRRDRLRGLPGARGPPPGPRRRPRQGGRSTSAPARSSRRPRTSAPGSPPSRTRRPSCSSTSRAAAS